MRPLPLAGSELKVPGGDWVIAEWKAGPKTGPEPMLEALPHIHHACDEAFYVLEGRLCFKVGDEVIEADAGSAVYIPKGTAHTYWNPEPVQARYLLVMTAKTAALIDAFHGLTDRSRPALEALFRQYQAELL